MKTLYKYLMVWALFLACSAVENPPVSAQPNGPDVPGSIDLAKVKFEIVDAIYVRELHGANNRRFEESEPDTYRGIIVTVKVTKPADESLRMAVQDVSLHYKYGENFDIAACSGLSQFSTDKEVDRPMNLYTRYGFTSTGTYTRQSEVVYVDAFFQNMESDTRELYLSVAQPVSDPFSTPGWATYAKKLR